MTDFSLTSTLSYSQKVAEYERKLELLVLNCPETDVQEKEKQEK